MHCVLNIHAAPTSEWITVHYVTARAHIGTREANTMCVPPAIQTRRTEICTGTLFL
eukprot:COSAG01_NODE_28664_length_656_cov_0.540395_1_plen_55_part_01